jgi:hypothetical protein
MGRGTAPSSLHPEQPGTHSLSNVRASLVSSPWLGHCLLSHHNCYWQNCHATKPRFGQKNTILLLCIEGIVMKIKCSQFCFWPTVSVTVGQLLLLLLDIEAEGGRGQSCQGPDMDLGQGLETQAYERERAFPFCGVG